MAVDVANGLAARGNRVHLIATRELGPLTTDVHQQVQLSCLERRGRFDLRGLRRLRHLVDEYSPEVVHAHGWSSLQFCTVALLAMGRPPALVFHNHRAAALGRIGRSYRLTAWIGASAHVAVDPALLTPPLRTRRRRFDAVIPNGVPADRFLPKADYAVKGQPSAVALANLRREKDHPVLLRALRSLADQGNPCHLDLVGAMPDSVYESECRKLVTELALEGFVHIRGPRGDTQSLLATYDVGVLSSAAESGPLALIEYLFAGLPFVVTDVGQIPASLPLSLRRWVVPPGDPSEFARKLQELLALSPTSRAKLASTGRAFAREQLSIDRTVDAIESVYEHVSRRGEA